MRPRSRVPRGVLVATGAVVLVAVGIAGLPELWLSAVGGGGHDPAYTDHSRVCVQQSSLNWCAGLHRRAGLPSASACSSSSWAWPRPRSWKAG